MKRQNNIFFRKPSNNPYRIFFLLILILGGVWLVRQVDQGKINRHFTPTPTPTRGA
jgi:hypothetical protein